ERHVDSDGRHGGRQGPYTRSPVFGSEHRRHGRPRRRRIQPTGRARPAHLPGVLRDLQRGLEESPHRRAFRHRTHACSGGIMLAPPNSAGVAARPQHGFSLIEVLVALLVLSVGLLGLAMLQIEGLKHNTDAYYRTQATVLAYDIIDRMRANSDAAKNG